MNNLPFSLVTVETDDLGDIGIYCWHPAKNGWRDGTCGWNHCPVNYKEPTLAELIELARQHLIEAHP